MAPLYYKPVVCPIVIGRAPDLALLERAIEEVGRGPGRIILVAGEAGIGKSRLLAEVRARAERQGLPVLQGHCFEADRSLPYAPFIDLLRTALASQPSGAIVPSLVGQAEELVKLLPEVARWLPERSPTPALDPEGEKRRIFRALARCFTDLATSRPAVLIIEDLQWSDETSLDFLLHLSRRLPAHPLIALLTYRADEVPPSLSHTLAELDRARLAVELRLGPLTVAEVDAMLRAIFSLRRPVRADFLDALYALTEGNPFFIEEVLKAIVTPGAPGAEASAPDQRPLHAVPVPRTVQEAVQRRSRQLSQAAHQVLALAAVVGRRFDFALLRDVLHIGEQDLLHSIKELIAAQLVVEVSAEQFAFRHALTRQAIYDDLLARERRALHQIVGETLERRHAAAGAVPAAALGHHYYEAGAWAKAGDYAERAGKRAQALYAPRAAIDLFTRAIDATRHLGRSPTPAIYRARGLAHETLGDFSGAQADHETALGLARGAADRRAEWQTLLDLGLLWAGRDYARAGECLRQALALARALGDPGILASSLNRLGNWHVNVEQPAEVLGLHEEALAVFRKLDDPRGLAETLDLLSSALLTGGDLPRGTTYGQQAIALFRDLDDRQGLASSLAVRVFGGDSYLTATLHPALDAPEALAAGELALQTARAIGWRAGEAFALTALGFCLGAHGDYARALGVAQESLAIATEIGHRQWLTGARCLLGRLELDLLAPAAAQQHLECALVLARENGSLIWERYAAGYLALAYIAQHALARAGAALDAALDATAPMRTLGQRLCWCARAELALAQGAPDLALRLADRLVATAPHDADERPIANLWRLRGEALAMLHRPAEAEAALRAARAAAHGAGTRPLLWRIQLAGGRLYRVQARHTEAREAFASARAIITELAATLPDEASRDDFLRRATALLPRPRPQPQRRAARHAAGGLTARECEVAVLIARGLTNRQIATELVITEETAAVHVKHILSKLGFASRARVAAWVAHTGLSAVEAEEASG